MFDLEIALEVFRVMAKGIAVVAVGLAILVVLVVGAVALYVYD